MQQALEEAARAAGGQVEITLRSNYRSYRLDPASAPVRRADAAARLLGLPVRHRSTGGGSDANFLNERGIPTAVLCCGFEKVHTCEERIAVAELTRLAQWVAAILTGGDEHRCLPGEGIPFALQGVSFVGSPPAPRCLAGTFELESE